MNKIKILCISDYKDPLIYSESIYSRFNNIDIILSAGDLDMSYYEFIITSLNKPLLFVFGNHNLEEMINFKKEYFESKFAFSFLEQEKKSFGAIYIGGRVKKIKNLLIAGLGGSMKYNNGKNQFTEKGMFLNIIKLIPRLLFNKIFYGKFLDILLTHAPPKGIHDKNDQCHKGFKVFLWFINIFKPKYLVHGHVHLYDKHENRKTLYKNTLVVNACYFTTLEIEV